MGLYGGSVVKYLLASAGDMGSVLGWEDCNPLLYSCLGNPMNKGTWWAIFHGGHKRVGHDLVTKQPQKQQHS